MSPALAAVALLVAGGAVLAVSARDARAALIGLAVALGLGPFLADPLPSPAVLGARVVTGVLVAYMLRAVVAGAPPARGERPELGSRLGWPAEAALAAGAAFAAFSISLTLTGMVPGAGPAPGPETFLGAPSLALAAGLASIVVGVAPSFVARSSLRTAIGLLVLLQGIVLARTGLAGQPGELEQLGINGLVLALGSGGALLAMLEAKAAGERPETAAREAGASGASAEPERRRRIRLGASR